LASTKEWFYDDDDDFTPDATWQAGWKAWFGLRMAASDMQLWECTIFLGMTKPIYSFRTQLPLWLGWSVDLHNNHLRRCRISCAVMIFAGWHYLCTSAWKLWMQRL
jgi:hypothetical protein